MSSDWDWDWNLGPGTWDLGPGTWDLGPGTWDLGPGTWDLGIESRIETVSVLTVKSHVLYTFDWCRKLFVWFVFVIILQNVWDEIHSTFRTPSVGVTCYKNSFTRMFATKLFNRCIFQTLKMFTRTKRVLRLIHIIKILEFLNRC